MKKLVEIKNLITRFKIGNKWAKAVRGIDLDIYEGETLGIVGESGSGKSVSVLSLIQLIPNPPGEVSEGQITFKGEKIFDGEKYNNLKTLPKYKLFPHLNKYIRAILTLSTFMIFNFILSFNDFPIIINFIFFIIGLILIIKIFYNSPYDSQLKAWRKKFFLKMRELRGNEIAMIFQEPMTSLNPVFTIGFQIVESIRPLSIFEYFQNYLINKNKENAKKTLKEYFVQSGIFGLTVMLINQLTLGWTFLYNNLLQSFLIGMLIPSFFTLISKVGYGLIPNSKKLDLEKLFNDGVDLLRIVGIPDPKLRMNDYPHQFSGGMRQRAMIAMALAKKPSLLIADEPTTALDVTIQAQILNLMTDLKEHNSKSAVVLITHDMAVVAETCDRVVVMYGGMIQEVATVDELFNNPLHPYTDGLLKSIPSPELNKKSNRLEVIEGIVPNILSMPTGCKFCTRCDLKEDICEIEEPPLKDIGGNHLVRCHVIETQG